MSENKTKPTGLSVDAFLDRIADATKLADCQRLRELMETASGAPATMWGTSIVGFGHLHYRYASGREGDTAAVGFSPRASAITLYITGGFEENGYIFERLGTFKIGKGCLYVKRLSDVNESALIDLIHASLDKATELNVTT